MNDLNDSDIENGQRPGGIQHALTLILRGVAALSLFLMMVVTFVDVVGRFFHAPIYGAAEMIQFLLAILIFSGLGLATAANSHIRVDLLDGFLNRWMGQRTRDFALMVCHLIGTGLIGWQLGRLAIEGLRHDRRSIVLEWPEAWVILLGAIFVVIALIFDITGYREARDPSDTPEETI